jgi:putative DNA primase/helicase
MSADLSPPNEVAAPENRGRHDSHVSNHHATSAAAAIALLERGFHVLPMDHPDHPRCIGAHVATPCDGKRGKHPAVAWKTWAANPTPQTIELAWAKRRGLANIGISCGPSGLVVFDEDAAGEIERWCVTYGITLPDTYTVTTGRGRHVYYRWDHTAQRIGGSEKALRQFAINIRGDGGLVVAEGSRHESGAVYTGNGAPIVDLPEKAAGILLEGAGANVEKVAGGANDEKIEIEKIEITGEDPNTARIEFKHRHNALVAYAGRLRNKGLDYAEALPVFRQRWLLCEQPDGQIPEAQFHSTPPPDCDYPVTWEEAEGKLRDVFGRYAAGHNLDEEVVDEEVKHSGHLGMAIKLGQQFDGKLLYVNGIGWHRWDGKRWAPDGDGAARRAVHAVIKRDRRIVKRLDLSAEEEEKALKAIARHETASAISGILTEAAALQVFSVTVSGIDADPFLLNVANGTLDLHTMELRAASPADRITKVCRGAYHRGTKGAVWNAFLEKVLPDEGIRGFVQRLTGLALLGEVREHILPIFTGTGANGKGTFYKAVLYLLDDYGCNAEADLFTHREDAHPTGQMDLRGRRFVVVSETDEGRRLAEATMKRLTGGDPVTARYMRENFVTFTPSHLPILVTNHLPKVSGDDPAIWRRIRVVPFEVVIADDDQDGTLDAKLQVEADAVLSWAVEGLRDYLVGGLAEPDRVVAATARYRTSSHSVARFIEEVCHPAGKISAGELFDAWERWRRLDGTEETSKQAFGRALARLGYESSDSNSKRWWHGLCILAEEEQ